MPTFVKYKDTDIGYVTDDQLQTLLNSNMIISFKRSGKWVDLSSDQLREQGFQTKYNGPDRRKRQ
jgi:hypothetical protein